MPALAGWLDAGRVVADGAAMAPRLAFNAVRHGVLPTAASAPLVVLHEGPRGLHWKLVGDALVRFAQHSGPLATKLGQILATRGDLLPEAVCARLEALYARQPPMTRRQLDAALATAFPTGLPFASFDRRALAVGSIAEVHRATLGDGESVIVKLVRPGLARAIERDVNAATATLHVVLALPGVASKATRVALFRALDELGAALRAEADLRREARALADFGRRLRSNRRVCVPRVHRHWSGETALVMEELVGEPLSAYRARAAADPEAARRVADLAFREILKQVFEDGRFHADPHAGNLLVLPDGRLGLIDLGLTGEAKPEDRTRIARAVRAFVSGDPEALVRALLGFGVPPPGFDYDAFKADVLVVVRRNESHIVAQLTGRDAAASASSRLETFVYELFRVAEDHDLYVPPSSTLLVKTIVTIEGVARSLDPQLNVVAAAVPIVLRALGRRWLRWDFWREWSLAS